MKKILLKIFALCMVVCSTLFVFTACGESPISFKLNFIVDNEIVKTIDTTGNEKIALPNDPQKDGYTFDGWFWDKDVWEKPFTANSLLDAPLSSDMSVYAKFKPNHEHEYESAITKQPTCTEKGIKTFTCFCGDTYTENIAPSGHTPLPAVEENRVNATCTENGSYDLVTYCSVCGEELSREQKTIDKLGHTPLPAVEENRVNATCTENGSYDFVTYCSVCGEELSREQKTIDKLEHNYESKVTAPTCTEQGYTTYICSRCNDSYVDNYTDELGHLFTNYVSDNNATFESDGTKTARCDRGCGATDTVIDKGSKLVKDEIRFKTLNVDGTEVYGKVSNETETFSFINELASNGKAKFFVSTDINGNNVIASKTVGLTVGDNKYYITETVDGEPTRLFTVIVRRRPIYTVTFNANGGSAVASQKVEEDSFATEPTTTRAGYTFNGWDYDFTTPITNNTTIKANWQIIEYAITYDLNGGTNSANNPGKYTVEQAVTLSAPTKKGYTFAGWSDNGKIAKGSVGNKAFSASWQIIEYAITYNLNGGTNSANNPGKYTVEQAVTLSAPTKKGYTFAGWSDNGKIEKGSINNKVFTASWIANTDTPYKVEYYLQNLEDDNYTLKDTVNLTGTTDMQATAEIKTFEHFTPTSNTVKGNINGDGNTTIKVYYTRDKYTVKILAGVNVTLDRSYNGMYKYGYQIESVTAKYNEGYLGYEWKGWHNGDDVLIYDKIIPSFTVEKDMIFTADFIVKEEMSNFNFTSSTKTCTITGVKDKTVTEIVVPDYVTSINGGAFYYCSSLSEVTIPDSVTSIRSGAFSNCSKLTNITVSKNNTNYESIDGNLYSKDGKTLIQYAIGKTATTFTIPDSVTSIGDAAFYNCRSLSEITIPDSVTSIESYAFRYCSSLTSIYYTGSASQWASIDGLNNIMSSSITLYINNEPLTNVVLEGITEIKFCAFYGYSSIESVTIGNSVTSIGYQAFYGCSSLTSIYYTGTTSQWASTDGLSNIMSSGRTLYINNEPLTNVVLEGITEIKPYAFFYCSSLESVTIGNSVTSIGSSAFYYCSSLTEITIPDSVTSIESYAFYGCNKLTSVTIGNGVTIIGSGALYGCSSLTSITVSENNTKYKSIDGNLYSKDGKTLIQYAIGKTASSFTIPDSVTSIGDCVFQFCSSLESITIGNSVKSIGYGAFLGCSSLNSVKFKNTSGWYVSTSSDATSGTSVNVTNVSVAATYLKATYSNYYWKRK